MSGIKVDDLIVGEMYKCRLSGRSVLVIQNERTIDDKSEDAEEGATIVEPVKYSKYFEIQENGTVNYKFDQLFNGQLTELKLES